MSSTIQYCESCGGRIAEADLASGRAMWFRDACYCPNCRLELQAMLGSADAPAGAPKPSATPSLAPTKPAALGKPAPAPKPVASPKLVPSAKPPAGAVKPDGRGAGEPRPGPARPAAAPRRRAGPSTAAVGAIAVAVALVVALTVALALRGPSTDTVDVPTLPALPPSIPPSKPAPPDPHELVVRALRADVARAPNDFLTHLDRVAELRETLAGTPQLAALAQIERDLEQRLERVAGERFDQLLRDARQLIDQGQLDDAIARWGDFGAQLANGTWRERVALQVRQIEALRDAKAALQPRPTPPATPSPTPPEPRPDRVRPAFDGRSLAGWTLGDPTRWRVVDGAIVGAAGAEPVFARITPPVGAGYTLRFALRRTAGYTYFRYHWRDSAPKDVYGFNLPTMAGTPRADDWIDCTVVIRDVETVAYYRRAGVLLGPPFQQRFAAGLGQAGFILGPAARIELRDVTIEPHD